MELTPVMNRRSALDQIFYLLRCVGVVHQRTIVRSLAGCCSATAVPLSHYLAGRYHRRFVVAASRSPARCSAARAHQIDWDAALLSFCSLEASNAAWARPFLIDIYGIGLIGTYGKNYLMEGKKCLLSRWHKQFLFIPCHILSLPRSLSTH